MAKRKQGTPMVGGSSLLVIFAVLSLTVFALLTLSTVEAGGRLSEKSAQAVEEYYAADAAAEEILARLLAGERPAEVVEEDGGLFRYTIPLGQTQELQVALQLEDGGYRILQWQAVSRVDWAADESLSVWDGTVPG